MKNDNRGVTIVELLISIMIFGILVTAVFGFMLAGSRSYNTVSSRLNLDVQAQLALNQFESYIMDCNSCLYYSVADNTLYVVNEKENADGAIIYTAYVFRYKPDGCIYFGSGSGDVITKNSSTGNYTCKVVASDLLAENVRGFLVTPISSDGVTVTSAAVTIDFAARTATYSGKRTIALRNRPAIASVS